MRTVDTPSVLDITRAVAAGLTYEMHSPYWDSTSGKRDLETELWLSDNAAFIVRACNAHDELVATLRHTRECLLTIDLHCESLDAIGVRELCTEGSEAARAAIAKATA